MLDVNKIKKLINIIIDKTNTRALADVVYNGIKNFREKEHFAFVKIWHYKLQMVYSYKVTRDVLEIKKRSELYVSRRVKGFYSKKVPKGTEYDYFIHDSFNVLGENSGYEQLYLVGDNWKSVPEKPIALMVGFNDWKLGFSANYLPEYRTAFLPRKLMGSRAVRKLAKLDLKPSVVIVWGYTESNAIANYAKKNNVPIYRMEDGFIRSAKLGAQHSTPYSLVLDKTGFYYNCSEPSDIENIYNTYDFKADQKLLKEAEKCLKLLIELKISKYNPPRTKVKGISQNLQLIRRVAVLGQVDGDASIKYGNPNGWTSEELIKLAAFENPDCEIIYRPHPEVYRGFQKSSFQAKKVEKYARIAVPDEDIIDFIDSVDHVYTISSLTGFEALIRGKKVTTVGAPFYSGWGCTDDRVNIVRRQAKLNVLELFAGAYLLYPKYLGALSNSYEGSLAAIYRINAERDFEQHDYYMALASKKHMEQELLTSNYWPMYFFTNHYEGKQYDRAIGQIDFSYYFFGNNTRLFQSTLLFSVYGKLTSPDAKSLLLEKVRTFCNYEVFNQFLLTAIEVNREPVLISNLAWLLAEVGDIEESEALYNESLIFNGDSEVIANGEIKLKDAKSQLVVLRKNDRLKIETLIKYKNFDLALNSIFKFMLIYGADSASFLKIAQIAELTFDWQSVHKLANFMQHINIYQHNRAAIHMQLENLPTDREVKEQGVISLFAKQLVFNPDRINRTNAIIKHFFDESFPISVCSAILNLDNDISHQKVVAYLETGKLNKAETIVKQLFIEKPESDKLLVVYSKVLFEKGCYSEAEYVLKKAMAIQPTHANFTELLRLYKFEGRFEEAQKLLDLAKEYNVELTEDGHAMPVYFGLQDIERGFKCFLDTAVRDRLIAYFGQEKYKTDEALNADNLFLICSFGPAEEVRFASIYNEIAEALGVDNFKLSCEPRLLSIFQRSFPHINFVPISRARSFSPSFPRKGFDKTPGADLVNILDNQGFNTVNESKQIKLLSELIWHFRKDYKDFPIQNGYLKCDEIKTKSIAERLPKNKTLVGINWRSQLTNSQRNVHYLDIEQLEPLFELNDITFVNLQYDNCEGELAWVEARYPGKIINLPDIDQFNDFDSVLSLMQSLDLVIAPCTVTTDLAGAIGCPTIYFSAHGEIQWRMKDKEMKDVWFESMVHVCAEPGDKKNLVNNILEKLKVWNFETAEIYNLEVENA
ncbi:capsular polysaccharide export protein, LipB/KpsS family [Thalassotalea fusca]